MRKLVANKAQCLLCGDVIESLHRHDFVKCSCGNLSVDGGLDYCRRLYTDYSKVLDGCVYSDDPFVIVRRHAYRTGYGKPGNPDYGEFRKTLLKDMSDEHLQASLDYLTHPSYLKFLGKDHWQLLLEEKLYRAENEIYISE